MIKFTFASNTIAVDPHVHRVLNRTGIVNTKTPEETTEPINEITPDKSRKHVFESLIQHGMNTCTAKYPIQRMLIL